jgi:hypothetical protein
MLLEKEEVLVMAIGELQMVRVALAEV